jgi:catechol 2,3-dioxygenase-like lactoylglutathione lyase family enzyme
MLDRILAVTLVVPALDAALDAYRRWLGYGVVEQGTVSPALAAAWLAPLAAGRRQALLRPASGWPTYLRLVEAPPSAAKFEALRTQGWNANEILVQDPDALAADLARGSPFAIVGPPRDLDSSPTVRAFQAIGPAGELNYFTRIPPAGGIFIRTPAQCAVDRTFIVVVGGASMPALQEFYGTTLGLSVSAPIATPIEVLQRAWGLPAASRTRMAVARISDSSLVELDEYPPAAPPRACAAGDLPAGIALVSFGAPNLDARSLPWLRPPAPLPAPPWPGARAGLLRGPAGELLEVVETPG